MLENNNKNFSNYENISKQLSKSPENKIKNEKENGQKINLNNNLNFDEQNFNFNLQDENINKNLQNENINKNLQNENNNKSLDDDIKLTDDIFYPDNKEENDNDFDFENKKIVSQIEDMSSLRNVPQVKNNLFESDFKIKEEMLKDEVDGDDVEVYNFNEQEQLIVSIPPKIEKNDFQKKNEDEKEIVTKTNFGEEIDFLS